LPLGVIYDNIPALKTAEITGRKGDMQINPDGTKTMEAGGEKMIYQWNDDLNVMPFLPVISAVFSAGMLS
jgi:hypothetical protein